MGADEIWDVCGWDAGVAMPVPKLNLVANVVAGWLVDVLATLED